MSHERPAHKGPKKPYEVFDLTEGEHLNWGVSNDRFKEIIDNDQTIIHSIKESSNNFGEFLFVTASRHGDQGRICMTFYGCGYHEYRERWITNEWFWYQDNPFPDMLTHRIDKEEADELNLLTVPEVDKRSRWYLFSDPFLLIKQRYRLDRRTLKLIFSAALLIFTLLIFANVQTPVST